jgi:hypothetical protein
MTKQILFLFIGVSFLSCNRTINEQENYLKDPTISDVDGTPKDSLTFYYPTLIKSDSLNIETGLDTFRLNWYSSALYCANEPILYNYYQGHDIYRFLWLRSFHRPVVFSLHKKGSEVWLITKELDRQPEWMDMTYVHFRPPVLSENGNVDEMWDEAEEIVDSIVKADRKANIVLNETKQLSLKNWSEFELLLKDYSFWAMQPYEETTGLDGSEWIVEGHLKNKYWFVNRWYPEDKFRSVGVYLIEKSELEEEIY